MKRQAAATLETSDRPAGLPGWVTDELLAHTRRVWEPFYGQPLTPAEAAELVMAAGRLFQSLHTGTKP